MRSMGVLTVAFASLVFGCGGSSPPPVAAPAPKPVEAAVAAAPATPPSSLKRSAVKQTIQRGVGAFLQNVTVADWPAMKDGKFHGWTIKSIRADWGVDLKPGDVVTRVNGMPIERPEEADAALRSLEKAKSVRIEYERSGQPKTLELPIVDD